MQMTKSRIEGQMRFANGKAAISFKPKNGTPRNRAIKQPTEKCLRNESR